MQVEVISINLIKSRFCSHSFQMLKHVQISPLRNRSDSISLRSSTSFSSNSSCASSICGSPEPLTEYDLKTSSRSSSYSSLNDSVPQVRNFLFVILIISQLDSVGKRQATRLFALSIPVPVWVATLRLLLL